MRIIFWYLLFITTIFLQGCGSISHNLDLLHPPKLSEDQAHIVEITKQSLPEDAEIIQVNTPTQSTKYHFKDLNGDDKKELIVFYHQQNDAANTYFAIFDKVGSHYKLKQTISTSYDYIHEVNFVDLDKDGLMEILLCFSFAEKKKELKTLLVYNTNEKMNYKLVQEIPYYSYGILTSNTLNYFAFLTPNENKTIVSLVSMEYRRATVVSRLSLNIDYKEIQDVKYGNVSKNNLGIVIDTINENEQVDKTILYINQHKLEIVNTSSFPSHKFGYSADYDGNSILEIPIIHGNFKLKDISSYRKHDLIIDFYEWNKGDDFIHIRSTYYDVGDEYYVIFSPELKNKVHITTENDTTNFELNDKRVLSIKKILKKDLHNYKGYTILGEKKGVVFITRDSEPSFKKYFQFIMYSH